ncbi:poly(3-hydroxybutyrate) depolymerase [Massilia sp. CFBP9012]|uniref:extracellular catalytic domain type 2 short-chain-length polyhydroxyalkanoate depolymerase n=1 Tax=Massilia sp. CFBP9012 TaxID=3096531 RepID=UPI002A69BC61|nr:poly(3-hydroxybutyrate) depolymerase [Massilia sp. CFBP9012]MDY0976167.1 poly(3-hydroxybutyrate) depolymerase [Massilia sp. CFBP9012]
MKRTILTVMLAWSLAGAAMAQQAVPLPALGADLGQTTSSGLDSGGFMAGQLAVAYSNQIAGVGIIGGGPFYCAGTYPERSTLENAADACMNPIARPVGADGAVSFRNARMFAADGRIDPVQNLARQRVYIASGGNDVVVRTSVVEEVRTFYQQAGAAPGQIRYVFNREAGHAIATANPNDPPCAATQPPYINNCGFVQAHDVPRHLYPERTVAAGGAPSGQLIRFDQREFVRGVRTSMDAEAYVYVPDACRGGGCAVHIVFHGCSQGASQIGSRFYRDVGYNGFADANRLIVLYPQVSRSSRIPANPRGCWDFWGYSQDQQGALFATKQAPQMQAVMAMIERLGRK